MEQNESLLQEYIYKPIPPEDKGGIWIDTSDEKESIW